MKTCCCTNEANTETPGNLERTKYLLALGKAIFLYQKLSACEYSRHITEIAWAKNLNLH